MKLLRCAIYTRKSTEHGLEQEFNSLDNQREAAEAYIKSQAHEGWRLLPEAYDDGGVSGGSLDRPALQQLLAEVRAGRVDVIVVYKVDRLTRSLSDSRSWSSCSMRTGSRSSPSPRPSTRQPAWGG
jgi:site-specific DNA recombinase